MCNFKYRGCIQPSSHLIVLLIHLLLRSRLCTLHIDIVQHIKILQISILQMNNEHSIVVQSANCTSSLRATILSLTAHCADQKCEHCADQQCEQCKVHNAHLNSEQSAEMIWCAVCIDPYQDRIQGGGGGGGCPVVATTGQLGHPGSWPPWIQGGAGGGGGRPVATTGQLGHPGSWPPWIQGGAGGEGGRPVATTGQLGHPSKDPGGKDPGRSWRRRWPASGHYWPAGPPW